VPRGSSVGCAPSVLLRRRGRCCGGATRGSTLARTTAGVVVVWGRRTPRPPPPPGMLYPPFDVYLHGGAPGRCSRTRDHGPPNPARRG
jgi:hypothetical protein